MAVVLVVDDDPTIVVMIAELVEGFGHSVLTAADGAAALALARAERPALIISDVMMPVMDGFDLLQALRADPSFAHTRVYLMSGVALRTLWVGEVPPDDYILKPFNLAMIEGLLASIPP